MSLGLPALGTFMSLGLPALGTFMSRGLPALGSKGLQIIDSVNCIRRIVAQGNETSHSFDIHSKDPHSYQNVSQPHSSPGDTLSQRTCFGQILLQNIIFTIV